MDCNSDLESGGGMSLSYLGRSVSIRVSHIGIDEDFVKYIMTSRLYTKSVEKFKQEFK